MRIKPVYLGLTAIGIVFSVIMMTSALNLWHTESTKVPITFKEGEFEGEYNPDDIRGSYTFGDVSRLFDIPLADLAKAFGLSGQDEIAAFKNKDLELRYGNLDEDYEIGNSSVKLFVALYKGLPFPLEDDTYLLESAVNLLIGRNNLTKEQITYIENHRVDLQSQTVNIPLNEEEYGENERIVRGKTTFRELLDWGVPKENIEGVLGAEIPNPVMVIREFCQQINISFSSVKGKLQDEVDALNK